MCIRDRYYDIQSLKLEWFVWICSKIVHIATYSSLDMVGRGCVSTIRTLKCSVCSCSNDLHVDGAEVWRGIVIWMAFLRRSTPPVFSPQRNTSISRGEGGCVRMVNITPGKVCPHETTPNNLSSIFANISFIFSSVILERMSSKKLDALLKVFVKIGPEIRLETRKP